MTNPKIPITVGIAVVVAVAVFFSLANIESTESDVTNSSSEKIESIDNSTESVTVTKSEKSKTTVSTTKEPEFYEIVGKDIPPGYSFGNYHINNMDVGVSVTQIKNPDEKVSIRFTNQHSGVLSNVTLNFIPGVEREIKIGIQEDNGSGMPKGAWLNDDSFKINFTAPGNRVDTFVFDSEINLEEGRVYHIVLEPHTTTDSSKVMSIINFHSNIEGRPLNQEDPDIYSSDPYFNSLFFDGNEWIVEDKWPIFLIRFSDGTKDGQPYTLNAPWTVRGKIAVGQTVIPASDYLVSKFGFLVGKKGDPPEPLFYGIRDSENKVLASGKFVDPDQLGRGTNWVELTLKEPIPFEAGKLYRIYVTSPIPREDNNYLFYGHEFSYDSELGYGGNRHKLTISHNDGETWSAWYDADAVFKITTVG